MSTRFYSHKSQTRQEIRSVKAHGFKFTRILVLIVFAADIFGSEPGFAQSSSPMSPEKIAAKEKAVSDHAKKRADCKKQAKDKKLSLLKKEAFVCDCMAKK
jgi:hypothetical protein